MLGDETWMAWFLISAEAYERVVADGKRDWKDNTTEASDLCLKVLRSPLEISDHHLHKLAH